MPDCETVTQRPLHSFVGPRWYEVLLLFIPILRQTVLIRQRDDASNYTAIDFFAMIDIAAFLGVVCVMIANWQEVPWKKINNSYFKWWIIYYCFCLLSILWRIPGSSVPYMCYRALAMLIMTIYSLWLIAKFKDDNVAFQHIIKYSWWISCLGVLRAVWRGSFHTNSYSTSAAIVVIILLALHGKINEQKHKAVLLTSIIILIVGTSAGSNIAFACAFLLWFINPQKQISFFLLIVGLAIGYLAYSYGLNYVIEYLMPGKNIESLGSMTGRAKMWEIYINAWKESPWIGYGFPVGERAGEYFGYIYCLSAHNGFISVLINTGIVGVFIFGMFFFGLMIDLYKNVQRMIPYAQPIFLAMVIIAVNNLTYPLIGSIWGPTSQVCIFLFAYCVVFMTDNKSAHTMTERE